MIRAPYFHLTDAQESSSLAALGPAPFSQPSALSSLLKDLLGSASWLLGSQFHRTLWLQMSRQNSESWN